MTRHEAGRNPTDRLTDEQRRLVQDNLGLVAVHIRRRVGPGVRPGCGREWDELFQEGCLGLMQAARVYNADGGIPFASFALRRIQKTIHRALTRAAAEARRARGRCENLPDRHQAHLRRCADDLDRADPGGQSDEETIGQRLRGKYERAVREMAELICAQRARHAGRDKLIRMLVEERHLIPQSEARRPLRSIAREAAVSDSRVARYDRRIAGGVRRTLAVDPEFCGLRALAKRHPQGGDGPIDGTIERELAGLSSRALARRLRRAGPRERAAALHELFDAASREFGQVPSELFERLSPLARERVLKKTQGVARRKAKGGRGSRWDREATSNPHDRPGSSCGSAHGRAG